MNWTERFYRGVFNELETNRKGIHVTALVYDCLRRGYYAATNPVPIELDSGVRMWIGKKVHELEMSDNHELKLEWEGIHGTCDEYQDGHLCDKKTTRHIPSSPRSHHKKQLEYYRVLLENNGYEVNDAAVLYIDVSSTDVVEHQIHFNRKLEEVEAEMLEKKKKLKMALDKGWLPERKIFWLCKYCDYPSRCFTENNIEDPRR